MSRTLAAAAFFIAGGLWSNPAFAASCTITETNISFGSINVLNNATVDSSGVMSVRCTAVGGGKTVNHCVSIGAGSPAGDATSRKMTGPSGATLRFDLFANSPRTVLWGSWITGYDSPGVELFSTGTTTTNATLYARVLAGQQTLAPGTYSATFGGSFADQWVVSPGSVGACPTYPGMTTTTGAFSVTTTIVTACNVSATNLNFGTAGLLASAVDSTSTIAVQCTNGTPYSVGIDQGAGVGATTAIRKMTNGANTVAYSLFQNSSRTVNWGNAAGVDAPSGTGTGLTQSLTVYGRVPAQTTPPPGAFSDTVVVTVNY